MIKTIEKQLDRKAMNEVIGGLMMTPDMEGYDSYQLIGPPSGIGAFEEPDCTPWQYC